MSTAAPAPAARRRPAPTSDAGKTLGIVGLVLAFVFSLAGLIVSAIARSQSKKAGVKNTPATVGLVLSIIFLVLQRRSSRSSLAIVGRRRRSPGLRRATAPASPGRQRRHLHLQLDRTAANRDGQWRSSRFAFPARSVGRSRRSDVGLPRWNRSEPATRPRVELSLRLTLGSIAQGSTDPTARRDADGWWLALRLVSGAATLLLRERPDAVEALAWGDGAAEAIDGRARAARRARRRRRVRAGSASAGRGAAPPDARAASHAHRPHPPPPRADRARSEGDGDRGEERLARARHAARGARPRAGADRDAGSAARGGLATDPLVGVAPGRRRTAAIRHAHARLRRGRRRSSAPPASTRPRPAGACARCRASGSGRSPRPCSVRTVIRMR